MKAMDIIRALWDKDERGTNLTMIMFSLDYMDEQTGDIIKTVKEVSTNEPLASIADIGGYTTIRITYKYNSANDFTRMRNIMEEYTKLMTEYMHTTEEMNGMPCLRVTIKPMSLRGAMITAVNPIFHNIQPHDPMYTECNEMQLLFLPDVVGFYEDTNIDEEAIAKEVKNQIASEHIIQESAEKKKQEREAYQQERDAEMQEHLEKNYDTHGGHIIQSAYHGYGKDRNEDAE